MEDELDVALKKKNRRVAVDIHPDVWKAKKKFQHTFSVLKRNFV